MAVATVKVQPAGIPCQSELWLLDGGIAATSGLIPFVSTGSPQEVRHPVIMPSWGTWFPNLIIYTEGKMVFGYRSPEAVTIKVTVTVEEALANFIKGYYLPDGSPVIYPWWTASDVIWWLAPEYEALQPLKGEAPAAEWGWTQVSLPPYFQWTPEAIRSFMGW